MRSPFYFIVKPLDDKRYTNTKDIDGIIAILNWANKAFSDGTEKAKERDCWIEKLKTIRETVS